MRAACFKAVESVDVESIPDPILEMETDAIVKVSMAGLCGSDLHPFFGRETGLDVGTVMGHEFVGTVVQTGTAVNKIAVGDRVCSPFTTSCGNCFYCNLGLTARCESGQLFGWRSSHQGLHGCQSQWVRVPLADGTLMKIDETIDDESALLLGDNLSTGYFGASMAIDRDCPDEQVVAVVGCGTVGLLAIQSAFTLGAKQVFAMDPNPARLALAQQLGAVAFEDQKGVLAAVNQATQNRGADAVMEFVGLPQAQELAYELIRPGGRMSVIGCHCTPHFAFSPAQAYDKNLTYSTGRCPARHYMDRLQPAVAAKSMDLSWCITHHFEIDDAAQAYDVFSNRKDGCIKAVFRFD